MPELPEVESVCRALEGDLAGRRVQSARLFTPDVAAHPDAETFCAALQGRTFLKLRRRASFSSPRWTTARGWSSICA